MKSIDPQKNYNAVRGAVLKTFELSKDFDASKNIIKSSQLGKGEKNGIEAELVFFEKFFGKVKPTKNFGEKADFVEAGRNVFFDVTTSLTWKNPMDYVEMEAAKGAKYKLALVNNRTKEINIIPVSVPKCAECGEQSFHIAQLLHMGHDAYQPLSENQIISVYCPSCESVERLEDYSFIMHSPFLTAQEMTDVVEPSQEERRKALLSGTMDIIHCLSKTSGKVLFGLCEKAYLMTDHRGSGEYGTYLYWKKPCARNLMESFVDFSIIGDTENIVITKEDTN